ncbi:MAG: HEAT repeat domain-containing protein [Candidatus Brocadiia bacterium]
MPNDRRSSPSSRRRAPRRRPSKTPALLVAIGSVALGALVVVLLVVLLGGQGTKEKPLEPGAAPSGEETDGPAAYADEEVARWAEQLGSQDVKARTEAARELAALGPAAAEAVPALLEALAKPWPGAEFEAAAKHALRAMGEAGVRRLVAALDDPSAQIRYQAARALGLLGPPAADAVEPLIDTLEDDQDPGVRAAAAGALGAIGPAAAPALPALRRAAGSPYEANSGDAQRDLLRARAFSAIRQIQNAP